MTKVTQLPLMASNAFLVSDKKHILVDTGYPGEVSRIQQLLKNEGVPLQEIALIVLTHAHFDHAGNAAKIQAMAGCPIIIHKLEQTFLENGKNAPIVPVRPLAALMSPFMRPIRYPAARADVVIEGPLDLNAYGVDAKIIMTPGHTSGSTSVLTHDGHALLGDLVAGGWPLGQFRPEEPHYHYWYANMEDAHTSIRTVLETNPRKIYVGHGGPIDGKTAREFFLR